MEGNQKSPLAAVLAFQELADFAFEFAVPGMDGGAQGRLRRAALSNTLQNALYVAHAVGFLDVLDGGQRLIVGQRCLCGRQVHEAAFEHVVRQRVLHLEELREAPSASIQSSWFHELCDAFM